MGDVIIGSQTKNDHESAVRNETIGSRTMDDHELVVRDEIIGSQAKLSLIKVSE